MKNIKLWIALFLIVYICIELLSYFGLFILEKVRDVKYEPVDILTTKHVNIIKRFMDKKRNYVSHDKVLGWSIKKNGSTSSCQANSSGIRSIKEYDIIPPHDMIRISTFGDSFTHCDDVKNSETWQAMMEHYDSNIEVLNFGVGGFGLDQAYLRYLEEGIQYKPEFVLIGFMSENIFRHVNTFRPFYFSGTGIPFTKPRFIVENGKLSLVPNPMRCLHDYKRLLSDSKKVLSEIGEQDYYFNNRYTDSVFGCSPTVRLIKTVFQQIHIKLGEGIIDKDVYDVKSEAYIVTKGIFDEFYKKCVKNHSTPLILIFPDRGDMARYHEDEIVRYAPLLSYFEENGFAYIDLRDALKNADLEDVFSGHYTPYANKLVAEYILGHLDTMRCQD